MTRLNVVEMSRLLGISFPSHTQALFPWNNAVWPCDKWVPVTTAWRVLRLRMEKRPPIWRVAANKLNKQSRTADKGWSSSLGFGRGANNASLWKPMLSNIHKARCFFWRQNNPEVNYSPTRISEGGSVSRGSTTQQETEKGHCSRYMEC